MRCEMTFPLALLTGERPGLCRSPDFACARWGRWCPVEMGR